MLPAVSMNFIREHARKRSVLSKKRSVLKCVMFSTSSQMLRIIDEVGRRPFGPWPQNDFIREHARKRSVLSKIVLC